MQSSMSKKKLVAFDVLDIYILFEQCIIHLNTFFYVALDCKNAKAYEGPAKDIKVDTTLTVADEDMVDIALGKLNPQAAFMKGKLKISGNIMLTQKLAPLLKTDAKL